MSFLRQRRRLLVMAAPLAIAIAATALAAGGDLGPRQRVSVTGPDGNTNFASFQATVVYNPDRNEYLAVWPGETATDDEVEIFGRLLEPGGVPVGGQFRISTMGPDGNTSYGAFNPAATYNSTTHEYLVAWWGDDNTFPLVDEETEIFAQRLSATGLEVGTDDQRISAMGPDGNTGFDAANAAATYNQTANEYLLAWQSDDDTVPLVNGELEIFAQRLSATGAEVGTDDQRISTMGPDGGTTHSAASPAATFNPTANEYLIAWYGDDNTAPLVAGEQEVFAQRLAATGAEVGTDDLRISVMGPDGNANFDGRSPSVAYGATANEYLFVWDGDDNTPPLVDGESEIFARALTAPDPPADPVPTPTPDPTPPELPPADTKLDGAGIELAKKIVIKGKELKIQLAAGCAESCSSTASGSISVKQTPNRAAKAKRYALAPASGSSTAGAKAALTLKLKGSKTKRRKATRKIVSAITDGAKAQVSILVTSSDTAGNSATTTGSAKLKAKKP